jgi:hypothetical protein
MMAKLEPYQRVTGATRAALAEELKRHNLSGRSIRQLAQQYGHSYGFIHRMLTEAEVSLRGRGGPMNRKKINRA